MNMSINTAQALTIGFATTISALIMEPLKKLMKAHDIAFETHEIAVKSSMSLVIALAVLGYAIFSAVTLPIWQWVAIIPAVTVIGTVVLTLTHFVASIVVSAAVNLFEMTVGFISRMMTKKEVVA